MQSIKGELKLKTVYIVITSNFELFASYENGIDSIWTSETKAKKRAEELNEEQMYEAFIVDKFYVKK